jgi:hypothetical protein
MFYSIFITAFIVLKVHSTCYDYNSGDVYFTDNNILNSSYCASLITWPISNDTIANYVTYDSVATNLYSILYQRYQANNDSNLDADCLGIAQFTFCAYGYPTCNLNN